MIDIFAEKKLYPHSGKILQHFSGHYNCVLIAYNSFFTNPHNSSGGDYPVDSEIYASSRKICWPEVLKQTGLISFAEIHRGLKTAVGALKKDFSKPDCAKKIINYCEENDYWFPVKGSFDVFAKMGIYKTLLQLNKNEVFITDELYQKTKTFNLKEISGREFVESISYDDHHIYSADKEILFTTEWDSFFFLIATREKIMETIIRQEIFEGFLCDNETTHHWDFTEEELEKMFGELKKSHK